MSVSDARKILRASQMEKVKANLMNVSESSFPYSEFLGSCVEACENREKVLSSQRSWMTLKMSSFWGTPFFSDGTES
ncbi:hypothetical protein JHK86_048654 [Glycine max]|nr:hypothetical protein JHK86_048654 [Glycine max]